MHGLAPALGFLEHRKRFLQSHKIFYLESKTNIYIFILRNNLFLSISTIFLTNKKIHITFIPFKLLTQISLVLYTLLDYLIILSGLLDSLRVNS